MLEVDDTYKTIKIKFFYNPELSKNRRYAYFKSKRKNLNHKAAQDVISWLFLKSINKNNITFIKDKSLIKLTWFRKNMRGDITNYINPICDAIKKCLNFDDNYFIVHTNYILNKNFPNSYFKLEFTGKTKSLGGGNGIM